MAEGAEGDRPDDAPPGGKNEKRRHPPVIELEATEVGEDGSKTSKPKPEASQKSEQPEPKKQSNSGAGFSALLPAAIAGIVGAAAGAVALYFALPFFTQPAGAPDATLVREVASLSARIEALSKQPAASPDNDALNQRIDKLTSAIAEAEKRLAAAERKPDGPPAAPADPSLDATSKELREVLAELKKLGGQSEQPAVAGAIEALSARISTLDSRVSSLAVASRASASSELAKEMQALNALSAAINSGKPFSQELGAVRTAIGPKASALDFLDASASKGIATVSALAERFTALAPKLLHRKDEGSGFFSRLYFNAVNLVQVRRIGEPQGDDLESVVARIESRLARGDLAGAVAETEKLPATAKSDAAAWIAEANNRRAADLAMKKILDAALAPEQPKS